MLQVWQSTSPESVELKETAEPPEGTVCRENPERREIEVLLVALEPREKLEKTEPPAGTEMTDNQDLTAETEPRENPVSLELKVTVEPPDLLDLLVNVVPLE